MKIVVCGFYDREPAPRATHDSRTEIELHDPYRSGALFALATSFFKRSADLNYIRIYNALGTRLGSYARPVVKKPRKKRPFKVSKKKNKRARTGWAARRGSGKIEL